MVIKIPKNSKSYFTRSVCKTFYGGTPNETLQLTFVHTAQLFVSAQYQHKIVDITERAEYISTELRKQWGRVNSELPLISVYSATLRVKLLIEKVNSINQKKVSSAAVNAMDEKLDSLFDISACNCDLPVCECSDREVNCKLKNCMLVHIVCQCNKENRVPTEERQCMKDQKDRKEHFK